MFLNINSNATVVHTNRLEKLHRSALPLAIRNTLNKAAFNVKQVTMPESAQRFVKRAPNFFKANSSVEMATGYDIKTMKSRVGFIYRGSSGNNFAVLELQQQEYGGDIGHRSFIPFSAARTGGQHTKMVRPQNRLSKINDIVFAKVGANPKAEFLKAAMRSMAKSGYVVGNIMKNNRFTLWRVNSVTQSKGRKMRINKQALYSFRDSREVDIKPTGFMRQASTQSAGQMDRFYIAEAERQIARVK